MYLSVFSLGRTTISFFHTPSKRSSNSRLVSFISPFQCTDSGKRDCIHFASFVCSSYRESGGMKKKRLFGPLSHQIFLKALTNNIFVRMHIIGYFCAILRRSFSTHRVIMGNFFRNGTLSSVFLPVSASQVSGRKPRVSFNKYSGSHETVSDDCSLETPITSSNKNLESPL